jgi:antitoxin PrlF
MKEFVATITSKGQITVPIQVRKRLGLGPGGKLAFVLDNNGEIHVRPAQFPDLDSLQGAAGTLDRPLTWKEMRAIAREDHVGNDWDAS